MMKKINNQKKAILLLYSYLIFLVSAKKNNEANNTTEDNPKYKIENTIPFAKYKDKYIYIVTEDLIYLLDDENPNNIYILDNRFSQNPTIAVYNSHKITKLKEINDILNILLEYEEMYPSNWNRSITSMKNEWIIHNICYYLNIESKRTKHVDLDNNDELKYLDCIKMISEIINTKSQNNKTEKTLSRINEFSK